MTRILMASTLVLGMAAGAALADHPYANGEEHSNGVAGVAVTNGTLHPGHVAIYGTGKGDPTEGKFNKPAKQFHSDDTYDAGPGGWAKTRGNK